MTPLSDLGDPSGNYVRRALSVFAGYGDREALVATDGRRFTYAQLRQRILNTAAALWEHGIRPGTTVGMLCFNPAESYFVQLGAHLLGARTVFMTHTTPPFFLRGVLGFVHADAFIYQVEGTGELGPELAREAGLPTLCIGAGGAGPDLTDPPEVSALPFDPAQITSPPESLFQTSGTTGTPKLVQHGQRYFDAIPKVAQYYRPPGGQIRHLLTTPTWHAGGQAAALMTWFDGGLLYMLPGLRDGTEYLELIAEVGITSCNITPPQLYILLDHPRLPGLDMSSFWSLTVSASPASPKRLSQAIARFGPVLSLVYGMSELPFISALPRLDHDPAHPERLASCGQPWGDVQLEIRDPAGTALPNGELGEIWVSSELVTEGYYGLPEVNAQCLVDGWFGTGDVGRLDSDGYLYIVDRVKDMIMTDLGSTNVFCRPLEDALAEHPQVSQAAVIGVPDEFLGEAIHAYVVRTPGATVTGQELRQLVVDRLNAQWSPREVEFIDAFPLTEYGKVDKKQLRAQYLAQAG